MLNIIIGDVRSRQYVNFVLIIN